MIDVGFGDKINKLGTTIKNSAKSEL